MLLKTGIDLMERGHLPDWLIKAGIRRLLAQRLREEAERDPDALAELITTGPIAVNTADANAQHYEVPAAFFEQVLGPHLKYSSCLWEEGEKSGPANLEQAEAAMLRLSCERAELATLQPGDRVLELGCGWGSLSLWMAEQFPHLKITAISNSASQAAFIRQRASDRTLDNVEIITCDINDFEPGDKPPFQRVVSVEMFEHCRNWLELTSRVARWLAPDGKLFVHIFTHRSLAYPYEPKGESDWMARYFFTGGIMPAHDQFERLHREHGGPLQVERDWIINGTHYGRTLYAWLDKQDATKVAIMPILHETYGDEAERWFERWRVFWMACGELFNYRNGSEWQVSHYRLRREDGD